jgi:hypothetical protein
MQFRWQLTYAYVGYKKGEVNTSVVGWVRKMVLS